MIRESLIGQLKNRGADLDHFVDLVEDYVKFWEIKNRLQRDIKKRGVTYEGLSSVGVPMQKNNPSVKELLGVNRQMLAILKELCLSTENIVGDEEDEL